tara:strand:- start:1956 stop:2153 length:198 start_codon:yes stop_codon:yes gene_type:complete
MRPDIANKLEESLRRVYLRVPVEKETAVLDKADNLEDIEDLSPTYKITKNTGSDLPQNQSRTVIR